jgi:hypothetical protein
MMAASTDGGRRFTAARTRMSFRRLRCSAGSTAPPGGAEDVVDERVVVGGGQVVSVQQSSFAHPTGGAVTDAQARSPINPILSALGERGLLVV